MLLFFSNRRKLSLFESEGKDFIERNNLKVIHLKSMVFLWVAWGNRYHCVQNKNGKVNFSKRRKLSRQLHSLLSKYSQCEFRHFIFPHHQIITINLQSYLIALLLADNFAIPSLHCWHSLWLVLMTLWISQPLVPHHAPGTYTSLLTLHYISKDTN